MIEIASLPHVLAVVNGLTVLTLVVGFICIYRAKRDAHRASMLAAVFLGCVFLGIYAYYKANSGFAKFGGEGAIRPVYFSILFAHVALAAVSLVIIPITLSRALRAHFALHKSIAVYTLQVWLFVAVSGLVVYVMAVHIYPYG